MYNVLCRLFHIFGLFALAAFFNRRRLAILMYHGVRDPMDNYSLTEFDHMNVLREEFRKQMVYLKSQYRIIPLSQAADCFLKKRTLPSKSTVITFDDGYLNNHTHAWPICRELQLPFTVFVATDFIGQRQALWTDRLTIAISKTPCQVLNIRIGGKTFNLLFGADFLAIRVT